MTPLATVLVERGISEDELVRRTGLTGRAVSHAYHGRGVSLRTWVKIAMALDVDPAALRRNRWPSAKTPSASRRPGSTSTAGACCTEPTQTPRRRRMRPC